LKQRFHDYNKNFNINNLKKNNFLIIASLFIFCSGCSQPGFKQDLKPNAITLNFNEQVDSIVINKMNQYNIPGLSIGIVKNDSIIYAKGYGVKSINNKIAVSKNSIFHTASISKLFTALAIVQLEKEQRLNINDKLLKIIPELNYQDDRVEKITIKTLLNHTSGIPDIRNYHWKNNNQSDNSLEEFVLGLNLKLESEPFSEYHYSNLGYNILGYVIEKVSRTTFDDYLKENILNSSGMYNSDFRFFKIPDSLKLSPHSKNWISKNIYARETYPYTREHAPSSTLNSSANELSKWMVSFLKTLDNTDSENYYSKMLKPTFSSYPYIGLGFQISTIDSKTTVGHYGGDKGFRSYLLMIPEEKIGLVLLANCDYEEDFRQEIIHSIVKLMLTSI